MMRRTRRRKIPMKPPAETDTRELDAEKVTRRIERHFPSRFWKTDERNELTDVRLREEEELNSYGWVDQKAGIVHIPIERAMQLIAERGLPVRPSETKSGASGKMAQSGKMAAQQQQGVNLCAVEKTIRRFVYVTRCWGFCCCPFPRGARG